MRLTETLNFLQNYEMTSSQGDKKRLLIEYDDKDVVTRVGAAPAAKKKVKKEEPVKEEDKPGVSVG